MVIALSHYIDQLEIMLKRATPLWKQYKWLEKPLHLSEAELNQFTENALGKNLFVPTGMYPVAIGKVTLHRSDNTSRDCQEVQLHDLRCDSSMALDGKLHDMNLLIPRDQANAYFLSYDAGKIITAITDAAMNHAHAAASQANFRHRVVKTSIKMAQSIPATSVVLLGAHMQEISKAPRGERQKVQLEMWTLSVDSKENEWQLHGMAAGGFTLLEPKKRKPITRAYLNEWARRGRSKTSLADKVRKYFR